MYLFKQLCNDLGIHDFQWLYTEAGHGKGPADGIGGAIKRTADGFISTGRTIQNASDLANVLADRNSNIVIKVVSCYLSTFNKLRCRHYSVTMYVLC